MKHQLLVVSLALAAAFYIAACCAECSLENQAEDPCATMSCYNGSRCTMSGDEAYCTCDYNCPEDNEQVCASDRRVYSNECVMKRTGCRLRKHLRQVSIRYCSR